MRHLFLSLSSMRAPAAMAVCVSLLVPSITRSEDVRPPTTRRAPRTTPSGGPGAICTAVVTVRQTAGAGGCFIDERVTGAPGVLRYPCAGGPATAAFATATFAGTVTDGVVDLRLVTSFDFSDHCRWQSTQTLHGTLDSHRLAFTYHEAPAPNQRGCASACSATATATVTPSAQP